MFYQLILAQNTVWQKLRNTPKDYYIPKTTKFLASKDTLVLFSNIIAYSVDGQNFVKTGDFNSNTKPLFIFGDKIVCSYGFLSLDGTFKNYSFMFTDSPYSVALSIINDTLVANVLVDAGFTNPTFPPMFDIFFKSALYYYDKSTSDWVKVHETNVNKVGKYKTIGNTKGFVVERGLEVFKYEKIGPPTVTLLTDQLDYYYDTNPPSDVIQEISARVDLPNYMITQHNYECNYAADWQCSEKDPFKDSIPFKRVNTKTLQSDYMTLPKGYSSVGLYRDPNYKSAVSLLPDSSWLLHVLGAGKYFRSDDAGNTWKNFFSSDDSLRVSPSAVFEFKNKWYTLDYFGPDQLDSTKCWFSDNKGKTWQNYSIRGFDEISQFNVKDNLLQVNNKFSKNNGATWINQETLIPASPIAFRYIGGKYGWMAAYQNPVGLGYYVIGKSKDTLINDLAYFEDRTFIPDNYVSFSYSKGYYYGITIRYCGTGGTGYCTDLFTKELGKGPTKVFNLDDFANSWSFSIFSNQDTLYCKIKENSQAIDYKWSINGKSWHDVPYDDTATPIRSELFTSINTRFFTTYDRSATYRITSKGFVNINMDGLHPDHINQGTFSDDLSGNCYFIYAANNTIEMYYSFNLGDNWDKLKLTGINDSLKIIGFGEGQNGKMFVCTANDVYYRDIPQKSITFIEQDTYTIDTDCKTGTVIYPNPASQYVTISNQNTTLSHVKIYNSIGTLSFESLLSDSKNLMQINTIDLPNGIYLLLVNGCPSRLVKE